MIKWFSALETSASALTAERLRMDVISGNIANANTTRTAEGGPYRRQMVQLESRPSFASLLAQSGGAPGSAPAAFAQVGQGVRVAAIVQDQRPFKLKYDPTHPDADATGYVQLPNVETVTEMVDLMTASRAYEANVTALNAFKAMVSSALQIGK
jgi:flagellar basal-body rod protein FlgC